MAHDKLFRPRNRGPQPTSNSARHVTGAVRPRPARCFPSEAGEHQEKISFSTQIVERIEKSTGTRITVHQFRHAAGALILRHRPGEYELVRRILGHKSAETTKRFYLALETTQASEIFTDIIRNKLDFNRGAA